MTDKTKNKKRMSRGLIVGLAAVLLLSVSVFAAYGSTSGYGKYKDAVNDLLLNQKNVSLNFQYDVTYDGEKIGSEKAEYKVDGKNHSSHDISELNDEEAWYSVINGKEISFSGSDEQYYEYPSEDSYAGLLDMSGYNEQALKFANLLADSLVGDLKNNVVLVSEENGISGYELDVTGEQLPAVIAAGLDMMIAVSQESGGYVSFEEFDETVKAYYQKATGKTLPEDFFDKLYADDTSKIADFDELWEEYDKYSQEMNDYYQEILDKQENVSAVLYVKTDGSYVLYKNNAEMVREMKDSANPFLYLEDNAVFENGTFRFSLDENNRLLENSGFMQYSFVDDGGQNHRLEMNISFEFFDYGTTKVTPFDPGNRTKFVDEE